MKRFGPVLLLVVLWSGFTCVLHASPPAGYYLVWDSEFTGTSLDTTKWGYRLPGAFRDGYNTPNALSFTGSNMVITTYTKGGTNFTCELYTEKKFESKYGYWESSIMWGDTNGTFSAFWMLPPSQSFSAGSEITLDEPQVAGSEIDICEHRYVNGSDVNIANFIQVNLHYYDGSTTEMNDPGSPLSPASGGLATGFHTYGFLWTSNAYSFLIDGSQVYTAPTSPVSQSTEFALLDTAVDDTSTTWAGYIPSGGYPSQAASNVKMTTEYVRYYAPTNVHFWTGANSAYWNDSANWISNLPPVLNSDLTFSYLSIANASMSLGQAYSIDGLIFLTSSGAFSISDTYTLTLGAGGVDMTAASGNVTFGVPIVIGANQTWGVGVNRANNAGLTLTDNGNLGGSATLTKSCFGTLILSGTNSFSGTLNVDTGSSSNNDGIVQINASTAISHVASPIALRNTAAGCSTLQFDSSSVGITVPQLITLAGRNTNLPAIVNVAGTNMLAGGLTVTAGGTNYIFKSAAGSLDIGGIISATATGACTLAFQGAGNYYVAGSIRNGSSAALSVSKTNSGTLTLAGTNTYTGSTTVAAGSLLVNGSLAGNLIVNSNGSLGGSGMIGGAVTIQPGGTLAPGSATNTLTFGTGLVLAAGSTTLLNLNATVPANSQLNVTAGTMTLGGTLIVSNIAGTLAPGQSFKLFAAGSYAGNFAAWTLPPLNSGLVWDTNELSIGVLSIAGDPEIVAFGDDSEGQLTLLASLTNVIANLIAVAAGDYHSLALQTNGNVLAWGDDTDGQCDVPTNLNDALAIAAGGYHSLAIQADGSVLGWGNDAYGQITLPPGLTNIIAIAGGTWHSLALRADGSVFAWGDDSLGQTNLPAGLSNVVAIAAGGGHNLVLRSDGSVIAWGQDTDANGNYAGQSDVPAKATNVVAISAGEYHSVAVRADGSVVAWGDNEDGQCAVPAGLAGIVAVTGGGAHTVALSSNGTVTAWGENADGQCTVPASASNAVAVAAGESHTLVLLAGSLPVAKMLLPRWNGGSFSALIQTLNRKNYALEFENSLVPSNWTALPTVTGNGALRLLTDPAATGAQRFYRVQQW